MKIAKNTLTGLLLLVCANVYPGSPDTPIWHWKWTISNQTGQKTTFTAGVNGITNLTATLDSQKKALTDGEPLIISLVPNQTSLLEMTWKPTIIPLNPMLHTKPQFSVYTYDPSSKTCTTYTGHIFNAQSINPLGKVNQDTKTGVHTIVIEPYENSYLALVDGNPASSMQQKQTHSPVSEGQCG